MIKKHLIAFLSLLGLASSASPSSAQVLKGNDENSKSKTEGKIKFNKQKAEQNATNVQIQDKRKDKWAKAEAENKAAKSDLTIKNAKNETFLKSGKTDAEGKASKDLAIKKSKNSKLKLDQETLKKQNTAAPTKAKGGEQK